MKALLFALVLLSTAHAATNVRCDGKYQGKSVVLSGSVQDIMDPRSGTGAVSVDGREVANFAGSDAKINYVFLSAKVQNARGELVEGKITDLQKGSGLITRLHVPGFGIDFRNIPVTCGEIAKVLEQFRQK